jgi:hypothetical protein
LGEPSEKSGGGLRGRVAGAVLGFCLLSAVVFACWRAYVYFVNRGAQQADKKTAPPRPKDMDFGQYKPPADTQPLDVEDAGPPVGVGARWARVDDDPLGLRPPAGAARVRSARTPDNAMHAAYSFKGEMSAALEHYRRAIPQAGLRLAGDGQDQLGWHLLVFVGDNKSVSGTVALRPEGPDAKMVSIRVTVFPSAP